MIVYLDSSVLARAYLSDESGHNDIVEMLDDPELALITSTWTRIEVSGALVRAVRAGRSDEDGLLALLDADPAIEGPVTVVAVPQEDIEAQAIRLVRAHGIRAMDAWHLAAAVLVAPSVVEPEEDVGFATRDHAQSVVAAALGLRAV